MVHFIIICCSQLMHVKHFLLVLVVIVLVRGDNGTQVVSITQSGCSFLVRSRPGNWSFLYCNTPNDLALANWTSCISKCCPNQLNDTLSASPNYNTLNSCQSKDTSSLPFSLTSIIVFAVIAVIALAIFVCFCGIIMKLLKSLYQNRVMQEMQESMTIEWQKEQQYLTTDVGELRWCRKGRGNGRMRSNDSTCSICLEDASNAELFCRHVYHPQCIALWLKKSNFCPLCHREDIRSTKIYCPSCLSQYFICRKNFLIINSPSLQGNCVDCQEGTKISAIQVQDIQFPASQDLIFEFSSQVMLSPA